jgi:hypothetical protein
MLDQWTLFRFAQSPHRVQTDILPVEHMTTVMGACCDHRDVPYDPSSKMGQLVATACGTRVVSTVQKISSPEESGRRLSQNQGFF